MDMTPVVEWCDAQKVRAGRKADTVIDDESVPPLAALVVRVWGSGFDLGIHRKPVRAWLLTRYFGV